jgi:DNA-binding IclR family transcriptional regulator
MKDNFNKDQFHQSLAKAIQVLDAFDNSHQEWGIRELSRQIGVNPTTVYRIVNTLSNAGYLEQDADTSRYSLGPKVMRLANLYLHHNPLPNIANQVFETFADRFQYNFYLGTLNNFQLVYLAVYDGRGPIKIVVETGGIISVHTTAMGKVLLAHQDDDYIHRFLETVPMVRYTSRSITTKEGIWEQIDKIRQQGYALNDGEHYEEVGAVGVPVFNHPTRVTMAVALAYPRQLEQDHRIEINSLVDLAHEVASEIALRSSVHGLSVKDHEKTITRKPHHPSR